MTRPSLRAVSVTGLEGEQAITWLKDKLPCLDRSASSELNSPPQSRSFVHSRFAFVAFGKKIRNKRFKMRTV